MGIRATIHIFLVLCPITLALTGCSNPPRQKIETSINDGSASTVYFAVGSAELTTEARLVIRAVAATVMPGDLTNVQVTGHADTLGTAADNARLAQRRAQAVAAALTADGVPADRIIVDWTGEQEPPIATGHETPEAGNRVVTILTSTGFAVNTYAYANHDQEIKCLALTIYHEARGESEQGKLAVGHVVINRTHSALFPAGVCDVVHQGEPEIHRCQFSWWCDDRSDQPQDLEALQESLMLAKEIYYGCTIDPTGGALWYHSAAVKPSWSKSLGLGNRIDHQVFYRGDASRPVLMNASARMQDSCDRRSSPRPAIVTAKSDS
jgi:spore germination cell wall hydrolase CwlJ-like protein